MADKSSTYLGNKNLKRSAVSIGWNEDMVKEYVKCSKEPLYFIKKYVKIVNVDKGLVPFEPWPFQVEMIKKCIDDRFVIAKMPRQVGKTTTIAALLLWYVLFKDNFSIAILANKERQAREILSRIQLAYEHLPKWLQQGIIEWNKGNIELENGSKILASSTSSSAIRGTSQNLVYLDEFAFVPSNVQEEFFASVYPTISSGKSTKIVLVSTPNGLNHFHKLWSEAERGTNGYNPIKVMWYNVPGRDEKWRKDTLGSMGNNQEQFEQEYCVEFLGSSGTLIAG
jgi:phage terminase large subunit GpA-like protein